MKLAHMMIPGRSAMSPKGLLTRGLVLVALFLACHLAGLRPFTGILTGTLATAAGSTQVGSVLGVLYGLAYLAFVLAAPILLIAAGILCLAESLQKGARSSNKEL